jgi:hypothetical protein
MADQPTPAPVVPAAAPAPTHPVPPGVTGNPPSPDAPAHPAPPASQPVTHPSPAPSIPSGEPQLSPDQVIEFRRPDGTTDYARVADLVAAYQNRPSLSPDQLNELMTIDRAMKGDQEALRQLVATTPAGGTAPASPAAPLSAAEQRLAEIEQRYKAMERAVHEAQAVTGELTAIRQRNEIKAVIAAHADRIPHLARAADHGASRVQSELRNALQLAAAGQHPAFPGVVLTDQNMLPQHRQTILGVAMRDIEGQMATLAHAWGVQLTPAQQAAAAAAANQPTVQTPASLVDDQQPGQDFKPAQLQFDAYGRLVRSSTGSPVALNRMGHAVDIPTDPVNPAGAGTPLPVGNPPQTHRPFTTQELAAKMEARRQAMQANR